jgi:hypothetical protein
MARVSELDGKYLLYFIVELNILPILPQQSCRHLVYFRLGKAIADNIFQR